MLTWPEMDDSLRVALSVQTAKSAIMPSFPVTFLSSFSLLSFFFQFVPSVVAG